MTIQFGRDICGTLPTAETREWLVTNGIGGYASGTIAGLLTRRYHGLLIAALKPPVGRTLLLSKLDETVQYGDAVHAIATNRWSGGTVDPHGYLHIERFQLERTIPLWRFACADALLEKRVWMQPGENTTYIRYTLSRSTKPVALSLKGLVNYRDHHSDTHADDWQMQINSVAQGICITAFPTATPFYLLADRGGLVSHHEWYCGFDLPVERYRGLGDRDDLLHAATLEAILEPGESLTVVASTEPNPILDGKVALEKRRVYEQTLLNHWQTRTHLNSDPTPDWVQQFVLAADQFIVDRSLPEEATGKTLIAGYPWFGDWGRDTMISLPGLTIAVGRPSIARTILGTFARYLDQGMLPNVFPEAGQDPAYNTVDAILWYFEAIRAYHTATGDDRFLSEIFPALAEVIDWHRRGTRYNIHLDDDGLIYAGETGVQLTWMDAKIGDWVVTPRIGKPVEINALWYNALRIMEQCALRLGQPHREYGRMAQQTLKGFQRFWHPEIGYCYDVLDGPDGDDVSLRPNQIFAVSLAMVAGATNPLPLLEPAQQRSVVETCGRSLLTSYGLRSLAPNDPHYQGRYGGDQYQRDSAYHQGPVWGWLLGPYVQAHLRVYQNPTQALMLLEPMADHLKANGLGSISEIFDGDAPMTPRGCFAQAWSVAEVLRVWREITLRS